MVEASTPSRSAQRAGNHYAVRQYGDTIGERIRLKRQIVDAMRNFAAKIGEGCGRVLR
jgi:hypothetical protein